MNTQGVEHTGNGSQRTKARMQTRIGGALSAVGKETRTGHRACTSAFAHTPATNVHGHVRDSTRSVGCVPSLSRALSSARARTCVLSRALSSARPTAFSHAFSLHDLSHALLRSLFRALTRASVFSRTHAFSSPRTFVHPPSRPRPRALSLSLSLSLSLVRLASPAHARSSRSRSSTCLVVRVLEVDDEVDGAGDHEEKGEHGRDDQDHVRRSEAHFLPAAPPPPRARA